jgi:glycosyltransferase involved in cell wall biosynthesis
LAKKTILYIIDSLAGIGSAELVPTYEVLKDFDNSIGIKGKSTVLHNFVPDDFFNNQIKYKSFSDELKLVAVGNLKEVKNYQVLIDAFKLLRFQAHLYNIWCRK